jgi:integrase/recombinase XerD
MNKASRVRVEGPLSPLASRFGAELSSMGYCQEWSVVQLRLLAGLSRWLSSNELGVSDLTTVRVGEFFAECRKRGQGSRMPPTVRGPLVTFLRAEELLDTPTEAQGDPVDELVARFRRHLAVERGLRPSTIGRYEQAAQVFLRSMGPDFSLDTLNAEQVTKFVLAQAERRSSGSATNIVVGLRSFLRFAFVEGLVPRRLDMAAPTVANWRASALPKALELGVAERLVNVCDRRTIVGRRNYAVLHCLWRLGLRAGEVAALELEDLDWRAGEIIVHGKGGREERLPLPFDVGEAIAGYLRRGRPRSTSRALFLRAHAPFGPLTRSSVRWVVYRSCDQLGIKRVGPHRLRHTAAAHLLAHGASLEEVAQVLRHRSVDTTAIYSKIDTIALSAIALPWPGALA